MIGTISNNSLSIQNVFRRNSAEQDHSLQRLATGQRINSGSDDPAGLIAATELDAALTALDAESRGLQRVNSNATITDGHLSELTSMMGELRSLTVASANSGGLSDAEVAANQMRIDSLSASIQRFTGDAVKSLDGIRLPDDGNRQLAQSLQDAAASVSTLATGGANSLASGNFAAIQSVLDAGTTAFAEARGTVGAYQKDDVQTRLNAIAKERESIASAYGNIMDTDYAAEAANQTRSQILLEANVQTLKIANQNAGAVLSLLS
jgi:flagellin